MHNPGLTMNIAITGANSAVGQAILRRGRREEVAMAFVAAVRSERAAEQLPLLPDTSRVALISYDDSKSLRSAFRDASAVIHLAGLLIERPDSSYERANVQTTQNVVEAASESGVEKFVLVSAIGANERSTNRYFKTKGQAEALVKVSGLAYTILRVPLLLGGETEGSAALRRHLSRPRAWLIGGGRHLEQPLDVLDIAVAANLAANPDRARNRTVELAGPTVVPHREIIMRAARLSGRQIRISSIPKGLVRLALAIRQRVGPAGFSVDVLEVITMDTKLDPRPAADELGIRLTGLEEMIQHSLEKVEEE